MVKRPFGGVRLGVYGGRYRQPRCGGRRVGEFFDKLDITEGDALPSARNLGKEPMLYWTVGRCRCTLSSRADSGRPVC